MITWLWLLLSLGLVLWVWQNGLRAWEAARAASARACRNCQVQLLDDTVALEKLWLRRDGNGRLHLERIYTFEFTDDGTRRYRGRVIMIGKRIEVLAMENNDLLLP